VAPAELERARRDNARERADRIPEDSLAWRRKEFEQSFGQLLPIDAVDRLLEQARPKLTEARGMFMLGSGAFFYEMANNVRTDNGLSPEQRNQILALLSAGQMYLARTDVFDERRMTRALTALSRAARASGVDSYDDLRQLDFDALLGRFGVFLPAGKQVFAAYDLDVNGTLRSARFRTLSQDLDKATVQVSMTVLDVPVEFPLELMAADGDWYLVAPHRVSEEPFVGEGPVEAMPEAVAAEPELAVPVDVSLEPAQDSVVEVTIHRPVRVVPATDEPR
jgi:hypothetical protein